MRIWLSILGLGATLLAGCGGTLSGVVATDEQSVWVVQGEGDDAAIYRCTDTAARGTTPRPVCVRAPFTDAAPGSTTPAPAPVQ